MLSFFPNSLGGFFRSKRHEMRLKGTSTRKKICFVALSIYPCLSGKYPSEKIGGAELQQTFIGKGLRDKGYDVSFITMDYGPPRIEVIDNLTVYKTFREEEGLFAIRFLYPRLVKIWKGLIQADADIYYTRAAGFLPAVLHVFCRFYGKKFVFAASSDANFIPEILKLPTRRDKILYKYGLKRATTIIVQSNTQKSLLWKNFKLYSTVIPNFLTSQAKPLNEKDRKYILWVSTIRNLKRPMQFIRLAAAFPDEKFTMIGGPETANLQFFQDVKRESAKVKNLKFVGFQPFEETEKYFDKCKVFVNTSIYEGFPNTFLQAWRRGIPVISYVDPDNIIKTKKLGVVINCEEELKEALEFLVKDGPWDATAIMRYFTENHSYKVIENYNTLLVTI